MHFLRKMAVALVATGLLSFFGCATTPTVDPSNTNSHSSTPYGERELKDLAEQALMVSISANNPSQTTAFLSRDTYVLWKAYELFRKNAAGEIYLSLTPAEKEMFDTGNAYMLATTRVLTRFSLNVSPDGAYNDAPRELNSTSGDDSPAVDLAELRLQAWNTRVKANEAKDALLDLPPDASRRDLRVALLCLVQAGNGLTVAIGKRDAFLALPSSEQLARLEERELKLREERIAQHAELQALSSYGKQASVPAAKLKAGEYKYFPNPLGIVEKDHEAARSELFMHRYGVSMYP